MSTDDSRRGFPNCDCKIFIPLNFKINIDSVNLWSNASFATLLSAPTPQCCHATTNSKPAPTCQGSPTTHHKNCLPIIHG